MKSSIRKYVANRRNKLSWDEINTKSQAIQECLYKLDDFIKSNCILFYASYKKEVKTTDAIQKSLGLGKKVVLPLIVSQKKKTLKLSQIFEYPRDVENGPFGIPQPKKDNLNLITLNDIDLIIIPGLGFDLKGNRLGYGGGYYDRLLANKKKTTKLIGFAFETQIVDHIPNLEHDILVNKIITEERIITHQP